MMKTLTLALALSAATVLPACMVEADDPAQPAPDQTVVERRVLNGLLPDCMWSLYDPFLLLMDDPLADDVGTRKFQGTTMIHPDYGRVACGHEVLSKAAMLAFDSGQSGTIGRTTYAGAAGVDPRWQARAVPRYAGPPEPRPLIKAGMAALLNRFAYEVELCLLAPTGALARGLGDASLCTFTQGAYMVETVYENGDYDTIHVCTDAMLEAEFDGQGEAFALLSDLADRDAMIANMGRDVFANCGTCDKVCDRKVNGAWQGCRCPGARNQFDYPVTVQISDRAVKVYREKR